MPSGSFSKRARNTDSISNRKNCGGPKKGGLAPFTNRSASSIRAFKMSPAVNFKIHKGGFPCPENYRNNPGGQCSGGVGGIASNRNRGCNNLTICKKPTETPISQYTRISSNPTVEILIEGELNAAKLAQIATEYGHDDFKNPTEIIIGTGVTAINGDLLNGAASNPKRLQTFGFKVGSEHQCKSIGPSAFYQCTSLTSVNIPNSVKSISNYAFTFCSSLKSIIIPNSVTSIGIEAFYQCTSLVSVVIPDSVTDIKSGTFYECTSLASVNIGNSVTSIGNSVFFKCALTSIVFPKSITFIGNSAFWKCLDLVEVVFEANIDTSIADNAFEETKVKDSKGVGTDYSNTTTLGNLTSFSHNSDVTFHEETKPDEPETKPDEPETKPDEPETKNFNNR